MFIDLCFCTLVKCQKSVGQINEKFEVVMFFKTSQTNGMSVSKMNLILLVY